MDVVVFDSDVLIGFLSAHDAHNEAAVEIVRRAMAPGWSRRLCAVNLSEILVGPIRAGAAERVELMLRQFSIEIVEAGAELARRAAAVRAATNLKLPDAYAVATALMVQQDARQVTLASFDTSVTRVWTEFRAPD